MKLNICNILFILCLLGVVIDIAWLIATQIFTVAFEFDTGLFVLGVWVVLVPIWIFVLFGAKKVIKKVKNEK